jgi:hypothetical protein
MLALEHGLATLEVKSLGLSKNSRGKSPSVQSAHGAPRSANAFLHLMKPPPSIAGRKKTASRKKASKRTATVRRREGGREGGGEEGREGGREREKESRRGNRSQRDDG